LQVAVTFDPRRGYIATHAQLAAPVVALSLTVLRARIGAQMGGAHNVRLKLDCAARAQRDERRPGAAEPATDPRQGWRGSWPLPNTRAIGLSRPKPSANGARRFSVRTVWKSGSELAGISLFEQESLLASVKRSNAPTNLSTLRR